MSSDSAPTELDEASESRKLSKEPELSLQLLHDEREVSAGNADILLWIVSLETIQGPVLLTEIKHVIVSSIHHSLASDYLWKEDTHLCLETLPGCPAESFRYGWIL